MTATQFGVVQIVIEMHIGSAQPGVTWPKVPLEKSHLIVISFFPYVFLQRFRVGDKSESGEPQQTQCTVGLCLSPRYRATPLSSCMPPEAELSTFKNTNP